MKIILLAALLGFAAAQDPALPDGHYCMAGPPEHGNTRAHECHCAKECITNPDGSMTMLMRNCKAGRCHEKDCVCHSDETCEVPK